MNEDGAVHGHDMSGHTMPASGNPSTQAYIDANNRMHANMAMEFTGDADVDFVRGMLPHHQSAIDIAEVVLECGTHPQKMIEAHGREIASMTKGSPIAGQQTDMA